MRTHDFDLVIIGSGAGGGTMAHALAATRRRILVVERGGEVPSEPENWSPAAVWKDLRYRTTEHWVDADGAEFQPYTHYNVGGNTKYWGSVLYRLRREDFGEITHRDGLSPAWPITYEDLAPWYDAAERLYHVHGDATADPTEPPRGPYPHPPIPHADAMLPVIAGLRRQGLHPAPLPLGLIDPGRPGGCQLCNTCNSFPCRIHRKSDADVCCMRPAANAGVTVWTHAFARRLVTSSDGTRVAAVEVDRHGETVRVEAKIVVVSCGAVNSAVLLQRSATAQHPQGLANSSGLVGRRYMAHLATMMQGFNPFTVNTAVFQKTVAVNDYYLSGPGVSYPLGQIQSQGRTHGLMAKVVGDTWFSGRATWIPEWAYDAWVARGVDWLAMSEDLPRPDNRVTLTEDGRIRLEYTPNNVTAHEQLVREVRRMLRRLGAWKVVTASHRARNTTHQCGTLVFGRDPASSVLDTYCRTHDIPNLFVVDASFFPSSAAVNPGLTIVAQALRVADHLRHTDLRSPGGRCRRFHARGCATRMKVQSFSHVGITVSDFSRFVQFYADVFGCPVVGVADAPPERVRSFFGVGQDHEAPRCKIGWIRVPGGATLEIFGFEPKLPAERIPWNRVGLTHFSFEVRNVHKWHAHLVASGVEIVTAPEQSPRGHWFFFVRDFDGNVIELIDLRHMYYVLGWLGALGGWLFRRGMYKQYYR